MQEIKKNINIEKKKEWQAIRSKSLYNDPIVPESSRIPRQVKAEEGILAYLFRFPDKMETVMQSVSPEYFVTDFYKKVFVSYCKKMQNHSNFSISMFGDEFTDDEMGRITGIEAKNKEIIITEKNLKDFYQYSD